MSSLTPLLPSFGSPYVDMWMLGIPFAFVLNAQVAGGRKVWDRIRRDFPIAHRWDPDFCCHLSMLVAAVGSTAWPLLLVCIVVDWWRRRSPRDDDDDDQQGPTAGSSACQTPTATK